MDGLLATGRIRTAFALKGFVKVQAFSDDFSHFKNLKEVTLRKGTITKKATIAQCEFSSEGPLVRFVGVNNPEDAKTLNGFDILVPRSQASKLKKGEYYVCDLMGLTVMDNDGQELGQVESWCEGSQALLLEVRKDDRLYFIPFLQSIYIGPIDLKKKTLILLVPELAK